MSFLRWVMFPGINLHARLRMRELPQYFGGANAGEDRLILDAGCGNGMLSYESWKRGNRVIGVSVKKSEVDGCRRLFNEYLKIPEERLSFREWNLYELDKLGMTFDEIICSEVLEHINDDVGIVRAFARVLKADGVLHLCCPNAEHPDNRGGPLDRNEHGGHVRPGYTFDVYNHLLEPAGFRITVQRGLGGPVRELFNRMTIRVQIRMGRWAGIPVFLLGWPLSCCDCSNPGMPYSLYVKAVRKSSL